jgi:hypothetical protein
MQIRLSFSSHSRAALRERPEHGVAQTDEFCVAYASSFSLARQNNGFGIAPSAPVRQLEFERASS